MNKLVKDVFLMLLGVVVALVLYVLLFGTQNFEGNTVDGVTVYNRWDGALWFAARAVERPIARYYYEYCYLPQIRSTDYVDAELGCNLIADIQLTPTNLASGSPDHMSYTQATGDRWGTGWR